MRSTQSRVFNCKRLSHY